MADSVLGAQLYTVREFTKTPEDVRRTFEKVRDIGYEAVQVSGFGPIEPEAVAQIAQATGLKIVATHISYQRIAEEPDAVIAEHKLWDCPHVAIGGMPQEFRHAAGFHRFAVEASKAVRPLIEAGLSFSYHNHSFELERFGDRLGLEILYDDSDPAMFSAEIDTYWIQHGGANPVTWLQRLRDRMKIVHFKDMAIVDGKQTFAEVGEGNLEWPQIIQACRDAGVEWYLIEQDVCQRDPFESLAISFRNLRQLGLH